MTDYPYDCTAHELAQTIIRDVLETTGITATAGIGTNLFLAKVAMDIVAKHIPADENACGSQSSMKRIPQGALATPAADGLLARRPRHRPQARGARHVHDGGRRALLRAE